MLQYTFNSTRDTFDLIKRFLYILDSIIQISYIVYMSYRTLEQSGNFIFNVILLSASIFYFVYYLVTTREFYTKKQIEQRTIIKYSIKAIKYIVNICIVVLGLIALNNSGNTVDNMTMLMTLLMISGILFSVLFDFVIIVIDKRMKLIENSLYYDIEIFTTKNETKTSLLSPIIKLRDLPKVESKKMLERIKRVNDRQEKKAIRKKDFKNQNKYQD